MPQARLARSLLIVCALGCGGALDPPREQMPPAVADRADQTVDTSSHPVLQHFTSSDSDGTIFGCPLRWLACSVAPREPHRLPLGGVIPLGVIIAMRTRRSRARAAQNRLS